MSISLLFPVLLFSFLLYGFVISCFLSKDEEEILALCLPVSFAVVAFSALPSLFLEIDFYPVAHLIAVGFPVLLILLKSPGNSPISFLRSRIKSLVCYFKNSPGLLAGYLFILLHLFFSQSLVAFYGLGSLPGDWFGHYRITHEFLTHSLEEFPVRLPLFQLLQAFVLSGLTKAPSFGGDFYLFQLVQLLTAFSVFPVAHLLLNHFFGRKCSLVILLAFALLPYVIVQSLCTWPKMLASTFSLLSLYYYLNSAAGGRSVWLCGLFAGLSILSHWLGLAYLVALAIDLGWRYRRSPFQQRRRLVSTLFKLALATLIALTPIYLWGFMKFGFEETLFANLSILEKAEYSLLQAILTRVINLITTLFLPLSILIGLFRELPKLGFSKLGRIDIVARSFSWHFGSVLGNLSLTIAIALACQFRQRLKLPGDWRPRAIWGKVGTWFSRLQAAEKSIVIYSAAGIAVYLLLQPNLHTYGISLTGLTPSVLLIFGSILSRQVEKGRLLHLSRNIFFESMLVIWAWQIMLLYLDATYVAQPQTSDPALLLLNEVIQYKREFKLIFLGEVINIQKSWLIAAAVMSQIGIFALMIRSAKYS